MFVIRKKDIIKNKFVSICIRDTEQRAKDMLLQQLVKLNAKPKPTEIVEDGIYYETIDDLTVVQKYTIVMTYAGFFSYGSKEIKHEWICDFDIVEIPDDVDEEFLDYLDIINANEEKEKTKTIEVIKETKITLPPTDKNTVVTVKHTIKTTDMNLSYSTTFDTVQTIVDKNMYSVDELNNIPDGTIMDVRDRCNEWYLGKVLRSETGSDGIKYLRIHFNKWSPGCNEDIDINEPRFAKKHTYTSSDTEYTDIMDQEYCDNNTEDYHKLVENGLRISLEEFKNLKHGDIVEWCDDLETLNYKRYVVDFICTESNKIFIVDMLGGQNYRYFAKKGTFIKD